MFMFQKIYGEGFTFLEILLSIAILSLLATISLPIYQSLQTRNDLDIATVGIVQTLRRAQILAQSVDGDMSWGVQMQAGDFTLFKGDSYATRDQNFDEIFEMPQHIISTGISEIVFSKFTGLPFSTGAIILTSNNNETRNIILNTKGVISY